MVSPNNKVLVAMSGGVDSSVTAALLQKQGYEVEGITITTIKIDSTCQPNYSESGCCSFSGVKDASEVCKIIGIKHYVVDLTEGFKKNIIDNFIKEYLNGRTPNPCVLCNPLIKWGEMLKKADSLGCYYFATGHYAKVNYSAELNRFYLSKSKDKHKDQTYFLWNLAQEQLKRTILPLGNLLKTEVRQLAKDFGLPVYNKSESQEICFIPNNNYSDFIKNYYPEITKRFNNGLIIYKGDVIGKHSGYPFYTIGQRRGLGSHFNKPIYVKSINASNNTIEVGLEEDLYSEGLIASSYNIIKYDKLPTERDYIVKIRYKDSGINAKCNFTVNNKLKIKFYEKRRAITPGQSAVIYEGEDLIGGGIIDSSF